MRLPLVASLSTKDGVSNKNARLTNTLKETTASAEFAVVRPGLSLNATATGVGQGLVVFNDELISVYGTTLGIGAAGSNATNYTITDFGIQSVVCLGGDSFGMYGSLDGVGMDFYVGDGNGTMSQDSSGLDTAPNGMSWHDVGSNLAASATAIVIMSHFQLQRSDTGAPLSFSVVGTPPDYEFTCLRYGGTTFAAMFTHPFDNELIVHFSDDDGATWSTFATTNIDPASVYARGSMVYDGSQWVLMSQEYTFFTADFVTGTVEAATGITSLSAPGDPEILTSAYFDGYYYISVITADGVNYRSGVYWSTDGFTWTELFSETSTSNDISNALFQTSTSCYLSTNNETTNESAFYRLNADAVTLITEAGSPYFSMAANDAGDHMVLANGNLYSFSTPYLSILTGSGGGINPISTVEGLFFDFAQGVL